MGSPPSRFGGYAEVGRLTPYLGLACCDSPLPTSLQFNPPLNQHIDRRVQLVLTAPSDASTVNT